MTSPTKKFKSKSSQLFFIKTARLSASLEGLNSSFAQLPGMIWPNKTCQNFGNAGTSTVGNIYK